MSKRSRQDTRSPALRALSISKIYLDYERAFTRATGLSLDLCAPEMLGLLNLDKKEQKTFCALASRTNRVCSECYALQQQLEREAKLKPKTLKCFAGLCETAVPVRVGDDLIAFLRTGGILLAQPTQARFNRIAKTLVQWGAEVDLKAFEDTYFNTRVLTPEHYKSLIQLLTIFAEHLASCSNLLSLEGKGRESSDVTKARRFIQDHSNDDMSLGRVARIVNVSANYFSEKFRKTTGLPFVSYVARVRIEKAKHLLENPNRRVSEVAFEVGFRSLSQFNRAFRAIAGRSPRAYRQTLTG